MRVLLRNPRREVEIQGSRRVAALLAELVIRNGELVPGDAVLAADDEVEIRPVISGGT
jgi:sulfur carrier protein